jgi:cullin-4
VTEELCAARLAPELYAALREEIEAHVAALGAVMRAQARAVAPERLLGEMNAVWSRHCEDTQMVRQIVLRLDRGYALEKRSEGVRSIWDLGLHVFATLVVQPDEVYSRLQEGLLALIERERRGEDVPRPLLASLLRMLSALGLYSSPFETAFLAHSRAYYSAEGASQIAGPDMAAYLHWVHARLREEGDRVAACMQENTRRPLVSVVESVLLAPLCLETVVERGLDGLLDENRVDELRLAYALFGRVNSLALLEVGFNSYLKRVGVEIVADKERDKTMVQELLDLRARCNTVVQVAFQDSVEFHESQKRAFEHIVNVRANKAAELIAKYVDALFKTSKLSDDQMEEVLERVMVLFRFVNGKDVFEAFYKKDLAKRLLLARSVSPEWEQLMIKSLKNECGCTYTTKLEGMHKDMDTSKLLMAEFAASKRGAACPLQLSLNVLTAGFWPQYVVQPVTLPPVFVETCALFEAFYSQKHESRRLTWHHALSYVTLAANFPAGRKQLHVSLFQAAVLLQFNEADTLSYRDLAQRSGLDKEELARTLKSLCLGKVRVLTRASGANDAAPLSEEESFGWKRDFRHKMVRIKINAVQAQESPEEGDQTREAVQRDRRYQIDAAIVRVMKTRRSLAHSLLVAELYNQLRFPVKPADIKRQLESLIEREYIERDKNNPSIFVYLA